MGGEPGTQAPDPVWRCGEGRANRPTIGARHPAHVLFEPGAICCIVRQRAPPVVGYILHVTGIDNVRPETVQIYTSPEDPEKLRFDPTEVSKQPLPFSKSDL